MNRRFLPGLVAVFAFGLGGCPDNPDAASTWTKKLDDQKTAERAINRLEELGDPSAIDALGSAWVEQGRPGRYLQVIISLARPLTVEEAKAKFMTDYDGEEGHAPGRPANWDAALPFLIKALDVDDASVKSVESGQKAADAMGEAKLGLDELIKLAQRPPTKKMIAAQVSAIRALGKFDNEKIKAAAALTKIIDADPPDHPRTAKDKDQQRAFEEKYGLFLGVTGASINALGELRNPSSAKTLVLSLYRTPELFGQIRRALVATGPEAKAELRKVLRDQNEEVKQLFVTKRYDKYCGYKRPVECQPVSAKDFYPAVVLGDFYDPASVPDLLEALKRPPAPVYYEEITEKGETTDAPSPNTQYNAIFDALRKIGSKEAASTVRTMWMGAAGAAPPKGPKGPKAEPAAGGAAELPVRILAISTYPFVTRDDQGLEALGAIAADNKADDGLRQEAATAFARLSHDHKDIAILEGLADKYFKASADKRKEADGEPKKKADAGDEEFKKATAAHKKVNDEVAEAKANALRMSHEKDATTEAITAAGTAAKAATERMKKADDDFKLAKTKHKKDTLDYRSRDNSAKAFKGYARMFQTHIARIEVAIRCKDNLDCYADTLKLTPLKLAEEVFGKTPKDKKPNTGDPRRQLIKDIDEWTNDELLLLVEGEIERGMLELGKRGEGSSKYTDLLLDNAKSDDRLIRQSILLALPKIAKIPCNNCESKLEKAIKAGEGKTTIADLNLETTMLRNFFSWAGGHTPGSGKPPAEKDTPPPQDTKPTTPPAKQPPAKQPPAPAPKKRGK